MKYRVDLGVRFFLVCILGLAAIVPSFAESPKVAEVWPYLAPVDLPVSEFGGDARFIESPSFEPGAVWVIVKSGGKFFLTVASLPPETWFYREFPKENIKIEIPESIARVTREIWVEAMLNVRYAPKRRLGMDGTIYMFSTYTHPTRSMNGRTWSPEEEAPPKWLVEAGLDVLAFARSSERSVPDLERKLGEAKRKISNYYEEAKSRE